MRFRKKTFRRLGILLLILALLAGVGAYLLHKSAVQREARLREDHVKGLVAFQNGDYLQSLDRLERYLAQHPEDDEALFAYARARAVIELPNNQHLLIAREKLETLLKRNPDHLNAAHALMEVYTRIPNLVDLNDLTARLLARDPADDLALRNRRDVFMETNRLPEALPLAEQYAQLKPLDLDAHFRLLNIMYRLQKPQREMLAYAQNLLSQHPDDARFKLLYAAALQQAGQAEQANQYLADAIAHPLPDAQFIKQLTTLLDRMRRFDDSQRVLESTAERTGDTELLRILVTRLWQDGRNDEVLKRLEALDVKSAKADTDLVALKVLALFQTGNTDQAKTELAILAHKGDRVGPAWAEAITARFLSDAESIPDNIVRLRKCSDEVPTNGIFCQWIADDYWRLGETALAANYWQRAATLMPTWSTPLANLSAAQLDLGAATDALASAHSAAQRVRSAQSQINLAIVRFMQIERTGDEKAARDLLNVVQQMQAQLPGEPNTLPIYISLLARTGQADKAATVANTALQHLADYSAETLLRLASVSRAQNLGLEEQFLSPPNAAQYTPRLSLALAVHLSQAGKTDEGRTLLRHKLDAASDADKVAWLVATAQYLETVSDPTAAAFWKSLGDQREGDLDIQRTILEYAQSARGDRAFIDRTINRLKALTGEDGQQWKIERARFLIESPNIDDAAQAAILLTDIVRNSPRQLEPRVQLARALARTGNTAAAIEHLQQAQAIDPRNATVTLELVTVLQSQGRAGDVRDALKRLSTNALMTVRQRILLASMFADNGDTARAIALLEAAGDPRNLPIAGQGLLARLYDIQGKPDAAKTLYDLLLQARGITADIRLDAARHQARQSDLAGARQILSQYAGAESESIWAQFEEEFGDASTALAHYKKAAEAGTETSLLALIDYQMRSRDYASAAASAKDALAKLPASTAVQNRQRLTEAMVRHASDPNDLTPLIEALQKDPVRQADAELLKALQDTRQANSAEVLDRLRAVADRFPQHLGVQRAVIVGCLANHRIDDAVNVARRTADALPNDPQAIKLLVGTLRSAERWPEMRAAAERWKTIAGDDFVGPASAQAEALLRQNQPDAAARILAPVENAITQLKSRYLDSVILLAQVKTANRQGAQGRALLSDLSTRPVVQLAALDTAARYATSADDAVAWLDFVRTSDHDRRLGVRLAGAMQIVATKFDRGELITQSVELLNDAAKASPVDINVRRVLSQAYVLLGQYDKAEAELREVAKDPRMAADVQNDLAYVLVRQNKNLDEAESLLKSALATQPKSAVVLETQGRLLLARSKPQEARTAFEAALNLDSSLIDASSALAVTLRDLGDLPAARTQLERAETQAKARPEQSWHLKRELQNVRESLSRTE